MILALIGVLAVVAAAYSVGIDNGFAGDDLDWLFAAAKTLPHPLYLLTAQTYFFRPMEQLFFVLCLLVGGTWYPVYLAAAVLLHLVATTLVAELAWSLTRSPGAALAAAAWWGLLRYHAEVVLRPYGIADAIALAFGLLAFALLRRGRKALALVAFAVAVGGKENAVVLPIVFAIWAVMLPGGERRRWLLGLLPMGAVAAAAAARGVLVRSGSPSYLQPGPGALSTFWENIGSWLGPDLHYLRLNVLASSGPLVPLWLVGVVSVVAAVVVLRSSQRVRFAAGWTALTMLPTVFIPLQAARYHYTPTVGAALMLALILVDARQRSSRLRTVCAGVAIGWLALSLIWNLVGIQLEDSDFQIVTDLHRQAAASFATAVLPTVTAAPGTVCLFLPTDTMAIDRVVLAAWDRHPWWAPTTQKVLFRRADGILGMTNTWAFVTWVALGRTADPVFVVARPPEIRQAAESGRLIAVRHDLPANRFEIAPLWVAQKIAADNRLPSIWISLQPGRFDPSASGTAYP